MQMFHHLAFDGVIGGTQVAVSDPALNELLGSVDSLHIGGYAFNVSGSSPLLNVSYYTSMDLDKWLTGNLITNLALSTTQETVFQAVDSDPTLVPKLRYTRIAMTFSSGGNPQGYFRIWVTGRDQSRRARGPQHE